MSQKFFPNKQTDQVKTTIKNQCFKNFQKKVDSILSEPVYEIFMTVITFIVLYADDIRVLAISKDHDEAYYYFMLTCFFLFFMEIILLSLARQGYIFSFFFWMDLLSTFSTVMEIPLVMNDLLGIDIFDPSKSAKLAKAGRASRVSSKATKIIRVVRLIRLVRIAKLYKYAYKSIENKLSSQFKDQMVKDKFAFENIQKVQLEDNVDEANNDINVLRYNSRMIPMPKIPNIKSPQQNSHINIEIEQENIESDRAGKQISICQNGLITNNHSVVKIDPTNANPISNNNLLFKVQQSHQTDPDLADDNLSNAKLEQEIVDEGVAMAYHGETQVGKMLSDLTTKRAIMVMFSVMISIPLLDFNTYFQDKSAYDNVLELMEQTYFSKSQHLSQEGILKLSETFFDLLDKEDQEIYFLQVEEQNFRNNFIYLSLRDEEMISYQTESTLSRLLVNNQFQVMLGAILGLIRTNFVIVMLVSGATFFSKDANDLVVTPIENMLAKVQRICQNPLEAARIEEDLAIAEEQLKTAKLDENLRKNKLQQSGFETAILEKMIVKTGALLAIGFGEAGAEIIGANMKQQGAVNPLIPGRKIFAIFGFCDIRNFAEMTEVLEENVMTFVNEVAEIVHSTVNYFEGATNKNIGDAFLMIWKFPSDILVMNEEYPEILNLRMVNVYADMALLAFIKIFTKVRRCQGLKKYSLLDKVQERLPNYSVKMGYGLHVGWAIEGAIGSQFKIDASYLSPNVNMASRLEAATKQYGVYFLISGPFYRLLSHISQLRLRHIDRVTVKGSIQPIDFFTFDFDIDVLDTLEIEQKEKKQQKNAKILRFLERQRKEKRMSNIRKEKFHINNLYEIDEKIKLVQEKYSEQFYQLFHTGVNGYLEGRWLFAKTCLEKTKDMLGHMDGPSMALLNYMRQFQFETPDEWKGYRELTDK